MSLNKDVAEQSFIHPDPTAGHFRCLVCGSVDRIVLIIVDDPARLVCLDCENVLELMLPEVDDGSNPG